LPDLKASQTPSGESVRGLYAGLCKSICKRAAAAALLIGLAVPFVGVSASEAAAENRSLKLYFIHTKEKAVITYKRNGRFDPKGLQQINNFLRDWRRNEPTKMDPRLLDLVWEVYRRSGASDYIHVVSAYRSPTTNGALRSRTKGVAKNSQHMLGKAMDFYIPGVKLATLRSLAMKLEVGGVGYYPRSGSPFVHLDVGGVRAWPRMSRQELVQLFPKGNTVHLPADGKPLPGYDQALASYKKRLSSGQQIEIASASASGNSGRKRNLLAVLFGGGDEDEDADAIAAPAAPERPQQAAPSPAPQQPEAEQPVMVASAEPQQPEAIAAPVPLSRPAFRDGNGPGGLATALYSPTRNTAQEALQAAMPAEPQPPADGENFADLAQYAIPVPTLLGQRGLRGDAEQGVMMASADGSMPDGELAAVPLPASRPSIAEPLLASVEADPESEADLIEQQQLTPSVVAALTESGAAARAAMTPQMRAAAKPVEMAALPSRPSQPVTHGKRFNDGFDTPSAAVEAPKAAAAPLKGGRSAKPGQPSTSGGALTGDVLAKWALNTNRADQKASVKAPRVVTRTLSAEYSAAYAGGGFKPVTAARTIDPNRFSGPATR
jgi:uncharacterized protein YcbK (DUF882 family)